MMSNFSHILSAQVLFAFLWKNISACMFGIYLLLLVVCSKYIYTHTLIDASVIYRYDLLLLLSVLFQIILITFGFETLKEALVIFVFHIMAFCMEVFKVHVGSWVYPESAVLSIASVPLFAGFMYSAVGSYIARIHKNFRVEYINYPVQAFAVLLVIGIYANFFLHHYWLDLRWLLLVASVFLFFRTKIMIYIDDVMVKFPVLFLFVLLAVLIWVAENIATYSSIWLYPNQMVEWQWVSPQKITSWYLLMLLSFVLVVLLHFNRENDNM